MVDYFIAYESFAATVPCCTLHDSRLNAVAVSFHTLFSSFSLFVGPLIFPFNLFEVFNICNASDPIHTIKNKKIKETLHGNCETLKLYKMLVRILIQMVNTDT